ncbi:hypothetical protein [Cellulomonas marina]|uniref:Uncharacterized protein n=1 Tax=Cellulomonas marina TaxID=988821 RepID=A0A1I0WUQ9_9CELL|nr:hypothetical protein [Cellulomonas marina]GIG30365.1 hypothetical protein Cma02nite_29650 [Cellulomonas marina]SFA92502.1 hypothetical protein SAMN05421867_103261 [Cellulomonas marina]
MALVAVLVVVGLVALAALRVARVGASARDVAWLAGTAPGELPPAEAAVVARHLERHRRHRRVGGLVGVAFAVVVGIRWYASVGFGVGQHSPLADVLFCGVAGVLVGALVAEGTRLPRTAGAVTASLAPRPAAPHPRYVGAARGLVAAAVVLGVALLVAGRGPTTLVTALAGAAVVAVAEVTRARVVGRRRPVLAPRAARLDDRLRAFAAGSVALLELSAAVLTATWVLFGLQGAFGAPDGGVVDLVLGFASLAGLVVAAVLLHRAAPRPPRSWRPPVPDPAAAVAPAAPA